MMSSVEKEKKAATAAVGGKTARACDGCIRRRARWYCAADDAFLCQQCDASVHSANPLARRHERLRLRMAAPAPPALSVAKPEELVPAWFKRKARTPRAHHLAKFMRRMAVPEMVESDETNEEEEDEEEEEGQLLYRVPVFDPVLAEFCSPLASLQDSNCSNGSSEAEESKPQVLSLSQFTSGSTTTVTTSSDSGGGGDLAGFGPSEAELTEFAADMETLLGHGLDDVGAHDDSFYMHTLGLMDSTGVGAGEAGEMLEMDFECGSPMTAEEGQEQKLAVAASYSEQRFILNLDYEAIIAKWGSSPWTDGERPQLRLDSFWPDCMGIWMGGGGQGEEVRIARMAMDEGREARVTRYREKRRTRLFSKKIRYEVRKLNAEKRPRMKGRFVKRAPFAAAANTGAAACLS